MTTRHFFLLLLTFLSTRGRAQLADVPPALHFLADQLPEMGFADGTAAGDLGPTRLAYTHSLLEWRPSALSVGWGAGNAITLPWLGGFTPYQKARFRNWLHLSGGPNQLAGRAIWNPGTSGWKGVDLRYVDRARPGEADKNSRRSFFTASGYSTDFGTSRFSATVNGTLLRERRLRGDPDGLTTQLRRYQGNAKVSYRRNAFFARAGYVLREEGADHVFHDRALNAGRRRGEASLYANFSDPYGDLYFTGLTLAFLHTNDRLGGTEIENERKDRTWMGTHNFGFDVEWAKLTVGQQVRFSNVEPGRYLPSVHLAFYPIHKQEILFSWGRGGDYRDPLLNDHHLAYTTRRYETTNLISEDVWRHGVEIHGSYRWFHYTVQYVGANYGRYTAVDFVPDGNLLSVRQLSGVRRTTAETELGARFRLGNKYGNWLRLSFNYRYDDLRLPEPAGVLLPAPHAAWLRARATFKFGEGNNAWYLNPEASFMWLSVGETNAAAAALPADARSRLDAGIQLTHKRYVLALRGEQILRADPIYGQGTDAFSGLPLGSEYTTPGGRMATLTFGVQVGKQD